jgi:hypothetical protein
MSLKGGKFWKKLVYCHKGKEHTKKAAYTESSYGLCSIYFFAVVMFKIDDNMIFGF